MKTANRATVALRIDKKKLQKMKHFIQEDYIPSNIMLYMAEQEGWYAGIPAAMFVEREAIPAGGVAVHKGAKVFAKDERVGKVDEFLVEGKSGRITHLVLEEGHLWGKKDIAVPVKQIDDYENGDVYLKIDKKQVESLPEFDVTEHE
ncbi:MAG: PRC-barrel domain containing protein [Deltaproteobacteria bacterium]|nr:PRC-barrel domain containing protein [Deltaproteobacteria bacterium]